MSAAVLPKADLRTVLTCTLSSFPQPSLGDKRLAKGQTLGYINGYQKEDALREIKDLPPSETGKPCDVCGSPNGTGTYTSPAAKTIGTGTFADSPGKLPQWVENDRKVREGLRARVAHIGANGRGMLASALSLLHTCSHSTITACN